MCLNMVASYVIDDGDLNIGFGDLIQAASAASMSFSIDSGLSVGA